MTQPAASGPDHTLRKARASDAAAIGGVQVASWRTTYAGLVPDDYLSRMSVEDHARRWANLLSRAGTLELTFVVEENGEIVGFAMGGPEREGDSRFQGELYAIYLLRHAQGRGHGRAMVRAVAGALAGRGVPSMLVWVLRDNRPARGFYERLGGVFQREHELDFGAGFTVTEVAYGWDDVRCLLQPEPR